MQLFVWLLFFKLYIIIGEMHCRSSLSLCFGPLTFSHIVLID